MFVNKMFSEEENILIKILSAVDKWNSRLRARMNAKERQFESPCNQPALLRATLSFPKKTIRVLHAKMFRFFVDI